jgi:hypothetical protein
MKLKQHAIAAGFALAAVFSNSAFANEPTVPSILASIQNTTWTETTFSSLLTSSWNKAGTTLDFKLASENTYWSPWQTFGIKDDTTLIPLFTGPNNAGSTSTYILDTKLSGYLFSESNTSQNFAYDLSKVFVSSTGVYAFAHEDWSDNDYNDMVITMSVTAVPEPETYAMMLAGLGLMGLVARRKQQK